jgi:4-hydroxybenzoate polyprenyltransferase
VPGNVGSRDLIPGVNHRSEPDVLLITREEVRNPDNNGVTPYMPSTVPLLRTTQNTLLQLRWVHRLLPFNGTTFINLIRVRQWYKNFLVFTPIVFANLLKNPDALFSAVLAFCAFCIISSSTYIFNDISDASTDAYHPKKKNRPIAAGLVSKRVAVVIATAFAGAVIAICSLLPIRFSFIILGYFLLNILYSLFLKQLFIIDVLTIGAFFILRVLGGSVAVNVQLSSWLFVATFILALLLGFSKRSSELSSGENAKNHRKVLVQYDVVLLRTFVIISATVALIVYLIYAIIVIKNQDFLLTTPFVLYGILLFLSSSLHKGLDPDDIFRDHAFVANLILWGCVVVTTLYVF